MRGRGKVNSYFAVLLITIFGSGAAFIIVDVATTNIITSAMSGSITNYAALQQSILHQRNPGY